MSLLDLAVNSVRSGVETSASLARKAARIATQQLHSDPVALADPPPGSGLKPVMGEPGLPLIGLGLDYLMGPYDLVMDKLADYGDVSWGKLFGQPLVMTFSPAGTEAVLVNRDKAFANGPGWEFFIGPFFERGLMLLDFEEHIHHRRIMQQAFTRDRLKSYLKGMNAVLGDGFASWQPGPRFKFYPAFKQLTLDLAMTVFVGHHLGPEADALNKAFFDTVQAGTAIVRQPVPGGRWKRGLDGRKVLEEFFRAELPAKRSGAGDDLFTALCHIETEEGERFTDDDVVNHMIFLLMAAHDTSTTTTTTLVYQLAKHPEWQDRLRDESLALGTDHIEYDDLERLPSMQLAIKEALRLIAPVPSMARRTVKDTELLGHWVPEGTLVGVSPQVVHRRPDLWTEPTRFDPERFSEERGEDKVHQYAWSPFGGGAHKCIGMYFGMLEVTSALHQLLLTNRWSVRPGYEMKVNWLSLPYPPDGLPIHLERIR
ncbi:MAG: cytochrome P450 [Nitriliruptorales bacterium]|nr:cytochrome P450 [Nitriliruptorales bacterium]